jgi:hypothetical protein
MADKRPATPTRNPRVIIALGRGRTGKTVFLSWRAETAERDIPLRIIDADLNNPVLSQRYPGVDVPSGVDDDRRIWLEKQIGDLMAAASTDARHDMLLDLGGGDLLVKQWGSDLGLASLLEESGVDVVAVHMLGPDKADLAYLEDVESRNLFCPKRTALILNRGLVSPGRSAAEAFREVLASSVVKRVRDRGGRVAFMPPLSCMAAVERHDLKFREAGQAHAKLGPFDPIRVRRWLDVDMPAMRAELGDWIG